VAALDHNTFLRALKGAPLSVLLALWVHGSLGRRALCIKTGYQRDTVGDALLLLEDLGLVVRPSYRKWALASGFFQLPLPNLELPESGDGERRKNRPSGDQKALPERRNNRPSAAERRNNRPSGLPSSDQIDDEDEGDVDNVLSPYFPTSRAFLERLGIGGTGLDKMAQYRLFEVLAAYWYLAAADWPRDVLAVLRSHLMKGRETPYPYLDLAQWWLSASPDEHEHLITAVIGGGEVSGLSSPSVEAACKVYDRLGGLGV